ncbi:hypothetical protein [Henriciella mobilis]|nr:hypothetical protein [Henriciella mobilis]
MKDVLTIFFAALACLGVLLLWPPAGDTVAGETIAAPAKTLSAR